MKLTIIGGGPRGLSVAILAIKAGLEVELIDNHPINTWDTHNHILDFKMRSPSSFDLVTGLEQLQDWSLNRYLKIEEDTFATRRQFEGYLKHCLNRLKRYKKFNWIQDSVVMLDEKTNRLLLQFRGVHKYDNLVVATGYSKQTQIQWINSSIYESKLRNDRFLIKNDLQDNKLLVVGSGQGAAELASYLCRRNEVTWLINKHYSVNQYPIPSADNWGHKSCFSDYYFTLSVEQKKQYLAEVKQFTPTITPEIAHKVKRVNVQLIQKVDMDLNQFDYIFNKTGYNTSFKESLLMNLAEDVNFSGFLALTDQFKCVDYPIYVTGVLATHVGGPSQGSVFSSGKTAHTIIEDILK